ncbi:MAG: hypothetical protein L0H75_11455, partial [Nitrosospira sp.]|nr:hypothetical protein [Nitrosospira sp.]
YSRSRTATATCWPSSTCAGYRRNSAADSPRCGMAVGWNDLLGVDIQRLHTANPKLDITTLYQKKRY